MRIGSSRSGSHADVATAHVVDVAAAHGPDASTAQDSAALTAHVVVAAATRCCYSSCMGSTGWGSGCRSQVAAASAQNVAASVRETVRVNSEISDKNSNFVGLQYGLNAISTSDKDQPVCSCLSGYLDCLRLFTAVYNIAIVFPGREGKKKPLPTLSSRDSSLE